MSSARSWPCSWRVPVDERDVLGRHLDVAGAALDQAPRQQAAPPEARRTCRRRGSPWARARRRRPSRRRAQQAIGGVERLGPATRAGTRRHGDGPDPARAAPEELRAGCGSAPRRRSFGGRTADAASCGSTIRNGPCSEPRKPAVWNALSVPISPSPFHRLADRHERRHVRDSRPERARDHRADVRHRHRLRRHVAGVPVVLVPRVQDEAEVGGGEAAEHRAAIHDAADLFEPRGELDVVDGGVDRRERAEDLVVPARPARTACSASDRRSRSGPCRRPSRAR